MNKKIIAISVIALLVTVIPLGVKAHPGRTDGEGGHTNRSTGEYHYHHGYSEHDHYDMDGDGDIDCPYNFKDKTNQSSKEPSKPAVEEPAKPESKKDYTDILGVVLSVGLYVFLMFILPYLIR